MKKERVNGTTTFTEDQIAQAVQKALDRAQELLDHEEKMLEGALRSARLRAIAPAGLPPTGDRRRQRIREYAIAMMEIPFEIANEGAYTLQELRVMCLMGAALVSDQLRRKRQEE